MLCSENLTASFALCRRVCSDYDNTVKDIVDNYKANYPDSASVNTLELYGRLHIPAGEQDVALCSRSWRWEWFCLFFQLACVASATIVSFMPVRMLRARFPLANMLSIATTIIMVSIVLAASRPQHLSVHNSILTKEISLISIMRLSIT